MKQQPTRVQFGCGLCSLEGWLNLDSSPTLWFAGLPLSRSLAALALRLGLGASGSLRRPMLHNLRQTSVRYGGITRGLPILSGNVRQLYVSKVIEPRPLVVPDLRHLVGRYLQAGCGPLSRRLRGDRHHYYCCLGFSAVEGPERWGEPQTIGFECRC